MTSDDRRPAAGLSVDASDGSVPARLAIDQLTVKAHKSSAEIVQTISLSVRTGEILGVVGESGSGKTTLGLAMLAHTRRGLEISSGAVTVDGQDVRALSDKDRRALRGSALAYVPQDPGTALNPGRRIGPQLTEALTAHGQSKQDAGRRIEELLVEVELEGVPNLLRSYPHQLSGGQQQRVTIAMAFACRPGLIVMDEPTTGLDATTQRTVLETVKTLCVKYGVAAIYISHDVLVVGTLADRVAVVYSGRVVELGTTADVFRSPRHPYTRGLLRAVPSPDGTARLIGIDGSQPRPGQRPAGCAFAGRCPVKFDRCDSERPRLFPAGADDHVARCFLVEGEADHEFAAGPELPGPTQVSQTTAVPVLTDPLLQVHELNANYGTRQVLHDISLAVPVQACVALVGESGSGKTTLARCLAGLHTTWTGKVTFQGQALTPGIRRRSTGSLREIQYIFQNPYASLNPRRTIGGVLAQPLEHFTKLGRREREQRVVEAIRSVSLSPELLGRYPDQLSGGERQRVAIARALVVQPRVLICDEVTSALDVSVQATVIEMLRQLQAEMRLTMLFITHNLALVRSIAQQVVVMKDGTIIESGPTDAVLDSPQTTYTRQLLEDVPKFKDMGALAAGNRRGG